MKKAVILALMTCVMLCVMTLWLGPCRSLWPKAPAVTATCKAADADGFRTSFTIALVTAKAVTSADYLRTRPYLLGTPLENQLKGHNLRHVSLLPIGLPQLGGGFETEVDATTGEVLRAYRGR
jgi:hypothetical protein